MPRDSRRSLQAIHFPGVEVYVNAHKAGNSGDYWAAVARAAGKLRRYNLGYE